MTDLRPIITALLAGLFSAGYGLIIHRAYQADPDTPYTFVYVAAGVAGTLIIALLVVPFAQVAILFGLFGVTGLGQVIGAIHRNSQDRQHAARSNAHAIRCALPGREQED